MIMLNHNQQTNNQNGFASLIIAIVLVLVLSLITVGFAQLMRHEQTASLDKQLSSQAYYAAESGINDAVSAINQGFSSQKTSCQGGVTGSGGYVSTLNNPTIGSSTNASVTCLLIDPHPAQLFYDDIGSSIAKVAEIEGRDPNNPSNVVPINTLQISWHDYNKSTSFASDCSSLPTSPAWGANTGIIKFGLTPFHGSQSRTDFINQTFNGYFCPNGVGAPSPPGVVAFNVGQGSAGGLFTNGNCNQGNANNSANNTQDYCNVYLTALSGAGASDFFFNMRSLYNQSAITITAYDNCASGTCVAESKNNQLLIAGAQVLIDSTGKAQNVLRRIQARLPAHDEYNLPGTSAGTAVCKQVQIQPNSITNPCE